MLGRLVLLGAAAAAAVGLVHATELQKDYPACPVNHSPKYYCCMTTPESGVIYMRYNRPSGKDKNGNDLPFVKYYEEGWNKARQINLPNAKYKPDTPEYKYDEPEKTCRVMAIVRDGAITEEVQCTFNGANSKLNTSWTEESRDPTVFFTSVTNPRNNNATFPVGATCTELGGELTPAVRAKCPGGAWVPKYRVTTYGEWPLVLIYTLYALVFVLIGLWLVVRKMNSARQLPVAVLVTDLEGGSKKLLDERGGPETPAAKPSHAASIAMRQSEVNLRQSVEDIKQTGYTSSTFANVVFVYMSIMTFALNAIVIVLICDNTGKFETKKYQGIFDTFNELINVFIAMWVICAVWFGTVVSFKEKLFNFYRTPDTLATCEYVHMFKPETTEVLLADRSGVSQFVARVEKMLFPKAQTGYEETVQVQFASDGSRFIEFQHLRFTYDDNEQRFVPGSVVLPEHFDQILSDANGLTTEEHRRRLDIVGRNAIEVEMPTFYRSIVNEFFSFFYIYQLMCYYVWFFTNYSYVAALNTVVIVVAAAVNIFQKRHMMYSVVTMTHYQCDVLVKRDGTWITVSSTDVAPGDLVKVQENWELPCDLVIVKGSTVCDESMLTGESMPVQKFPIPDDSSDAYVAEGSGKKYTLFSGTKTLSSGRNEEILAVAQSTGAHTSRGQLVQAILYPVPVRFKYDEHLKVVVVFLFILGFIAAYLAMKFLMEGAGLSNTNFGFVYGMFMFSAVLSPLLPVVITVGQVNAAKRLTGQGVFCLNPQRITLCGKVRVFCFDKTGTITKQGLDYRGCVPVAAGAQPTFTDEFNDMTSSSLSQVMKYALASCHAVGSLNGELVGNEVEVKMFKSTQWKLIEIEGKKPVVQSADGSDELEFVKRFEFDHHRMSMSVVMRHAATGKIYVFCKGSYEKMQQVSNADSVPADYKMKAESLAKDGCYVLGIAVKEVAPMGEEAMNAFLADRDAVETDLSLLGLIMFRNELKDDSRDAILTLKKGDIRTVMITGDNAMTGCYIARASGMVSDEARVILGDMVADPELGQTLVWKDVDSYQTHSLEDIQQAVYGSDDIELAVTGKAFDYLVKMDLIKSLLLNIRIFSRMTPQGKVDCVKLHMDTGAVTGMCGDGGNDCGALRIAHVGVALSEAEASVVSPFTSKTKSLNSIVDLVLEGRGALATSFGNVKFLIMYGLVGIGLRFTMYYNSVFVGEWGFIYCDGVILVGLSYAITRSRPLKTMGTQRPTSSLVGPTTVVSLVGQTVIHELFLYAGMHHLMTQPWYCPFTPDNIDLTKWWLLQDSSLSSSLWFFVCYQQMCSAITCSLGSKFRRMVFRNYFLMFYYSLVFAILTWVYVGEPTRFSDWFRVGSSTNVMGLPDIPLPKTFRVELFLITLANTATVIFFEWFVILGPVRTFFRNRCHKDSLTLKM
ncbi:TPA: hypothetical protein N0F65_009613 [Lagenidium giganteum]|uniref:Cation-transporting P-type ATPase N-terminal domain-containing protein n=1 Tax=Lagenidium giganteum TaxID=4803 RepID=A0AAV2YWS1_9STRA|nr:TPA: hypothetical protein N0F65_009613 [Lagenidium giganteum]